MQTTLPVGSIIQERYVVEDLLGKGGFSAVYLVRDRRVKGNLYALKELIDPSKELRACFTFEGEVLKRLDHPALPRVYRTFQDDKHARAYILLDYIEGPNLEVLRRQQVKECFPVSQIMHIIAPIFDAVGYLHKQQPPIIHRDIKPANIIVAPGGDGTVLVDFGIAKEYEQEGTTTVVRHCSPGYGAPEQYARGTNQRTDIYGLGATIYALVTGQIPVDALHRMTQLGSGHTDPLLKEPVLQVPQPLTEVIYRAMAINSDDRFASVEEFWQALNACPIEQEAPPLPPMVPAAVVRSYHVADRIIPHGANAATVVACRQAKQHSTERRSTLIILCIFIALLALLSGTILGFGLLSSHPSPKITHNPAQKTATSRTVTPSAEPGIKLAVTVTSTPLPTLTPRASNYPQVVSAYQGSIVDKFTQPSTNSTMSLSHLIQSEANIRGDFAVGAGLIGNGNFTGTVSTDNKMQFTVPGYAGNLPLLFQGEFHADGSISGTYCSYQGNNQCNYGAGGYGDWNIAPLSIPSS